MFGVGNKLASTYLKGCLAATQAIKDWVDFGCPESNKPSKILKEMLENKGDYDPIYLLGYEVTSSNQTSQATELIAQFIAYVEEEK